MAKVKDYAIGLAESVEVITCWNWEKCMNYVCTTPAEEVKKFIEENW